jgi:ABC-2 type transport system permease protein
MSCRRIGAITIRIMNQFRRDPRTIALIVIAPLLVMTLLGYVTTEKKTTLAIGIVNNDAGVTLPSTPFGGGGLLSAGEELGKLLEDRDLRLQTYPDEPALLEAIKSRGPRAGLIIPAGFTAGVLTGGGLASLRLWVEGSDPTLSADIARRFGQAVEGLGGVLSTRLTDLTGGSAGAGGGPAVGRPRIDYIYGGPDLTALSYFAPGFVAFAAFFFTFLLTSVAFLRERSSGTMERLLASPVTRTEIVLGYLLGFGFFALVQSLIILLFTVYVLGAKLVGSLASAFAVEAALVAVAVVMGIFFSFYARNELQVIQFIPLVIIPQVVVSGFVVPLETLWAPLRWLATILPMTYANRALRAVIIRGSDLGATLGDLCVLVGFVVLFTVLAARLIKRQVA